MAKITIVFYHSILTSSILPFRLPVFLLIKSFIAGSSVKTHDVHQPLGARSQLFIKLKVNIQYATHHAFFCRLILKVQLSAKDACLLCMWSHVNRQTKYCSLICIQIQF